MIGWVLEADLKNFFGSRDHEWVLRFVEHRVGDPRVINLIRRWLKAGVLEDGAVHPSDEGTPQGGSISVLLSNLYLHHVLDLWFERVVKCRLRGEARLVRYIDDFVICFQYRSDALRVQDVLRRRLSKFGLTLEPTKTKLVEFGRFAQRHAGKRGRKRPETIYFHPRQAFRGRSSPISRKLAEGRRPSTVAKRDRNGQLAGPAAGGSSLATRSTKTWANTGSCC